MFKSKFALTKVTRLLCAFILVASGVGLIFAQSTTADLSGTVVDEQGAVVPGVVLRVSNPATNLERSVTTNDGGSFTIPLLPPGNYTLRAERTGFAPVEIKDVVLNANDRRTIRINLRVGDVGATVTVESTASLIDTAPAVSTTVDRQFVENLPLNGRSLQSLIALAPGVTRTGGTGQFSVNGQRDNANYFTVDGVSANVGSSAGFFFGQAGGGAIPATTALGGTTNLVSIDALQEFKIQTSTYSAEFGRQPGGQVSLVTRSGTNAYRGTLFEYFRNDFFDANDWFANSRGLKRPPLRQNNFGGVIGGPLPFLNFGEGVPVLNSGKDRTFFFFSYEGLRLRLPQTGITTVPALSVRETAPVALRPFLNAFPRPTGTAVTNGLSEFAASYSNPSTVDAVSLRLDHNVNDKVRIFGRYNYSPSDTGSRTLASLNTLITTVSDTETLTGGANFVFSSKVTNELLFNYSRVTGRTSYRLTDFGGAVPIPESNFFPAGVSGNDSAYVFFILGGTNTALYSGTNAENVQKQINLIDNFSVVTGSHQLKFGVDYRRLTPVFGPRRYFQQATFSGIGTPTNPVSGTIYSGRASSITVIGQAEAREPLFTNLSFYGQDNWRATRRLTFSYGLRWDVNFAPSERNGNDPFTANGITNLATATFGQRGKLFDTPYKNFAPRIGAAYQLVQKPGRETVLRGGFGLFYDLGTGVFTNAYTDGFPFTASGNVPAGTIYPFINPATGNPPPFTLTPNASSRLYAVEPTYRLPRTYQYNVSVEQSLGANQTVTASYVGARGRRLLRQEGYFNVNPNLPGTIFLTRSTGSSDYNAGQFQFQRRLSSGLQVLASYTFAKSFDTVSSDIASAVPTDSLGLDEQTDRGFSDFDVRHTLNIAATYILPKIKINSFADAVINGWAIDTVISTRSATPINIVSSRDIGFGSFPLRPDLVTGVPLYLIDSNFPGGSRINPAAFSIPFRPPNQPGRQGNLGRNALRGFSASQFDLAVRRQFTFTERFNLQLRAEAFNLFNRPNFANPNNNLGQAATFGLSQNTLGRGLSGFNSIYQFGGPRSLQFAARFNF